MRNGRFGGVGGGYDARVTDAPDAPDQPKVPEVAGVMDADEADVLEQALSVDEGLPGAHSQEVGSRLLEANEADVLEQSLTVPQNEDDGLV